VQWSEESTVADVLVVYKSNDEFLKRLQTQRVSAPMLKPAVADAMVVIGVKAVVVGAMGVRGVDSNTILSATHEAMRKGRSRNIQ
jgi:hypothetical protein